MSSIRMVRESRALTDYDNGATLVFTGSFTLTLGASAWALGFFLVGAVVFLARERDFAVRL